MKPGLLRVIDGLVTIAVAVVVGYAVGVLFEWLWAPTPTPENSSPPPEAFLFLWGCIVGFLAVLVARRVLIPLWLRRRHRLGRHA